MAQPMAVLLPCRRFQVQVTFHGTEGLSPLEEHVLLAIGQGVTSIESLAQLLGLGPRMILDVCVDMLEVGYIGVDSHSGTLSVSDIVREHMGNPATPKATWPRSLSSSAPPEPQTRSLLQDLVSGAIFTQRRQPFEPRTGLPCAPIDPRLPTLDEIPKVELMLAVQEGLRSRNDDRVSSDAEEATDIARLRHGRIVDITLKRTSQASGVVGTTNAARFNVIIQLVAYEGVDGGSPEFTVVGPDIVPSTVRRRVASKLSSLWASGVDQERGKFFSRVRYQARESKREQTLLVTDPHASLTALEQRLTGVQDSGTLEGHEILVAIDSGVRGEIAEAVSYGGIPTLIAGAHDHHDVLNRALREAKHQVLLANPWVGQIASEGPVFREIERALQRGVNVAISWGISASTDYQSTFGQVAERVRELGSSRGDGGILLVADRPSHSHAKVIVSDLDWAVVTSCNFLNSGPERTVDELGLRVEGRGTTSIDSGRPIPARALREIVEWFKLQTPDYRLRRQINSNPLLFGAEEQRHPVPIGEPIRAPKTLLDNLERSIWLKSWNARVAGYRSAIDAAGTIVIPTSNEENRHALLFGITRAQRRLLVVSPELGQGLLGAVVAKSVMDASERGVEVTVIHDRWANNLDSEQRRRFDDLVAAGVHFVANRSTHAKVLVCDDWCLVGSFNLLTFEGHGRAELGLRVYDRATADLVFRHFEHTDPG